MYACSGRRTIGQRKGQTERTFAEKCVWRTNHFWPLKTCLCVKLKEAMDYDDWYRSEYLRVLAAVTVVCGASSGRVEDCNTAIASK